jgi:outer membrane protein insertion porin family
MNGAARSLLFICLLSFQLVTSAAAQKHSTAKNSPDTPGKLIALKVTGTSRYSDEQILAASGLQMGQNVAEGDFKEAAQRLGECGMFTDVAYSYSFSSAGTKLELQLADVDSSKLVPALFENFVWFTDDELRAAIQKNVPLFKDLLPIGGNLPDRVQEALQSLLSEKQLPSRVDFMRQTNGPDEPITAIGYRVEEVSIRIHSMEFPGASPEHSALLTTASQSLIGAEYGRSNIVAAAKFDLLPVYLQRGYLKATFAPSNARALPRASDESPSEVQVDAIVPTSPGNVYSTSAVDITGAAAVPKEQIARLIYLPLGQPANAVRLIQDLENVSKLYRSRGYMTASVKPQTEFDDDKHIVHYSLNVVEGDLYRMGEVEILGVDTQATTKLREAWTLREGQPYNADYPAKFLEDTRSLLPRDVQWRVAVHETLDAKDKTVEVEISFK